MAIAAFLLLACAGLGVYSIAAFVQGMRSLARSRRPQDRTRCPFCDYEIGVANQPRCPECGQQSTPELWDQWQAENRLALEAAGAKLSIAVTVGVGATLLVLLAAICSGFAW